MFLVVWHSAGLKLIKYKIYKYEPKLPSSLKFQKHLNYKVFDSKSSSGKCDYERFSGLDFYDNYVCSTLFEKLIINNIIYIKFATLLKNTSQDSKTQSTNLVCF